MNSFFAAGGTLSQHLSHYESRPDQLLMAEQVEAFLAAPSHSLAGTPAGADIIVIEAETGIGKSLAYLAPAIASGMRVVISTATINLQDQLIDKEIPLIERVLGRDVGAVCVKGRQNYLCLYRWYQHRYSPQTTLVLDEDSDRIEAWLEETESGDRAELDWLADKATLWPKISAHSYQCLGSECPEWSSCFVNRLRKKAAAARILVVNHHLYFSDLALRQRGFGEILPRHEAVIFDEAHHLEQVATSFFGINFSQYQVLDLLSDIGQQAEADLKSRRATGFSAPARESGSGLTALSPFSPSSEAVSALPILPGAKTVGRRKCSWWPTASSVWPKISVISAAAMITGNRSPTVPASCSRACCSLLCPTLITILMHMSTGMKSVSGR